MQRDGGPYQDVLGRMSVLIEEQWRALTDLGKIGVLDP